MVWKNYAIHGGVLIIEQKINIFQQFEKETGVAQLAKEYNIGKQTVLDIVKKKSRIAELCS